MKLKKIPILKIISSKTNSKKKTTTKSEEKQNLRASLRKWKGW